MGILGFFCSFWANDVFLAVSGQFGYFWHIFATSCTYPRIPAMYPSVQIQGFLGPTLVSIAVARVVALVGVRGSCRGRRGDISVGVLQEVEGDVKAGVRTPIFQVLPRDGEKWRPHNIVGNPTIPYTSSHSHPALHPALCTPVHDT